MAKLLVKAVKRYVVDVMKATKTLIVAYVLYLKVYMKMKIKNVVCIHEFTYISKQSTKGKGIKELVSINEKCHKCGNIRRRKV